MRHLKKGRKLNRTSSHKKALLRNLATALITHKKIHTTLAKAKELRPYVEKLITRAKKTIIKEQNGLLPDGMKVDVHSRRIAAAYLYGKPALQALFDEVAPKVLERPGGYTRIIKTGIRKGDSASTAIIHLVDWFDIQDGAVSKKRKRKPAQKPKVVSTETKVAPTQEEIKTQTEPVAQTESQANEIVDNDENETTLQTSSESAGTTQTTVEEASAPAENQESQPTETTAQDNATTGDEIIPSDESEEVKIKKSEE